MMHSGISTPIVPLELVNTQNQLGNILSQAGQVILKTENQSAPLIGVGDLILQSNIQQQPNPDNDNDKLAIYRHPLFPLMALLLEKCELAAASPDAAGAESFEVDIQSFVHQQEQKNKPLLTEDQELNNLMLKAIQVLRIHLLELEKVTDLCQDFCNRYISCLKGKMQSDTLLRVDNIYDDSDMAMMTSQAGAMTSQSMTSQQLSPVNTQLPPGGAGMQQQAGQLVSGGTVYQMVQTPQGIVAQPLQSLPQVHTVQQPQQQQHQPQPMQQQQHQPQTQQTMLPQVTTSSIIHGSTPLSKIGVPATPPQSLSQSALSSALGGDDDENGQSAKRGVLPKQATAIMKSWLFQHIIHPYPTEDEKRQIAQQTNLSLLQVNNWFINARRRILQPMLDSSDPTSIKSKKTKPQQSRPMQRFWPESIANIQPQTGSPHTQDSSDASSGNNVSNTPTEEMSYSMPISMAPQSGGSPLQSPSSGAPLQTPHSGPPMTSSSNEKSEYTGAITQ